MPNLLPWRPLHSDDLALARACVGGQEDAWQTLWGRYHHKLQERARALIHDTARAAELADGLWTDLYVNKLASYNGSGSLEGWLCALLAQAHVQQWRRERRNTSLEACEVLHETLAAPVADLPPEHANRVALESSLGSAIATVTAAARLLLSLYYLDGRTLAEIGIVIGVHESTVSRRLDRALNQLRRQTRRELRGRGLPAAAIAEAMATDPRWLHIDVRASLQVAPPARARTSAEKAVQRG